MDEKKGAKADAKTDLIVGRNAVLEALQLSLIHI